MADTGNGATVTFTDLDGSSSTTAVGSVRSINLGEQSIPVIDTSHLGTTNFLTSIPGDLKEPGEISMEVLFDQDTVGIPSLGTVEDIIITFPIVTSGQTTNATYTASGFFSSVSLPEIVNNELMMMSITFKCDGGADASNPQEPTFTAEAA
jgi:hypothetical protein